VILKKFLLLSLFLFSIFSMGCSRVSDEEVNKVVEEEIQNQVYVEGGTFQFGDVNHLSYNENDDILREITLSGYSISKYEVTKENFYVYLKDVGRYSDYADDDFIYGGTQLKELNYEKRYDYNYYRKPMQAPSWYEASGYCSWLAEKTGKPFALPTEVQWEFAARSRGRNVKWAASEEMEIYWEVDDYYKWPDESRERELKEDKETEPKGYAYLRKSTTNQTRPVGSYPPNPLGLYDMLGNVAEWTADYYQEDYAKYADSVDPIGPSESKSYYSDWLFDMARTTGDGRPKGEVEEEIRIFLTKNNIEDSPLRTTKDSGGYGGVDIPSTNIVSSRFGVEENNPFFGLRCVVNSDKPVN
tara:strand:+ start:1146 stop:2216 length:1071 start_codon:yes stop_codon:yes gene_type:complete